MSASNNISNISLKDQTILGTPKPQATSTVTKKCGQKRIVKHSHEKDDSLGILSLNSFNLSNENSSFSSTYLEKQRSLAAQSLERAKITGLPSKYLRPNYSQLSDTSCAVSTGTTANDSDLLRMSTNKSSVNRTTNNTISGTSNISVQSENRDSLNYLNAPRVSIGQNMARLSEKLSATSISFDNFFSELDKALTSESSMKVDASSFLAAEQAAPKLLADEMSWRKHNDFILASNNLSTQSTLPTNEISIGEYFKERNPNITDLSLNHSTKKFEKPVPLIEMSEIDFEPSKLANNLSEKQETFRESVATNKTINTGGAENKSLSISAIRNILSNCENTPNKVFDFLLKYEKRDSLSDQVSLPVSKNSSYTSVYSCNEALQQIVDKENYDGYLLKKTPSPSKNSKISVAERPHSSVSTSGRSSSSLTYLTDGKLPIETTKCELVFGCVKLNKYVTQEFVLRNKSSKTLRMQMSLTGQSFKIRKDNRSDSEFLSTVKFVMHALESRPITVSFLPTKFGAAIDELVFKPIDSHLEQTKKQCIRLFGYGGHGNIEIVVTKDISNKFWLNLGKWDGNTSLQKTFIVKNVGCLPCFVYITFQHKNFSCFNNVQISQTFFILAPQKYSEITVTYSPSIEDIQKLQSSLCSTIMDMGVLKVISSTEINRGRLRRLCRKAAEANLAVDPLSKVLKEKIEGEQMPQDIIHFKESTSSIVDILKLLACNEIIVTMEYDMDQTLIPQYPDESKLFHTLCDSTVLENTINANTCKIEPTNIILFSPSKLHDVLFIKSSSSQPLHFEAVSQPKGLKIEPNVGTIDEHQTSVINISCSNVVQKEQIFKVLIYVENEVFEACVKIIALHDKGKLK